MEIIGHRGYAARFPENTLPSLEGALAAGADSVEFDVRVAACGTPVLFHDETLERTTDGSGGLADRAFEALRGLDAGGWFDPAFAGTRIPSLAEALDAVFRPGRGRRPRRVYVEVKAVRVPEDLPRIVQVVRRSPAPERVVLISLDPAILSGVRRHDDRVRIGYVVEAEEGLPEALRSVRSDPRALLDPDHRILRKDPERTAGWIEEGLRIVTWTVNDDAHARELLALGVRRITTDDPGGLLASVRGLSLAPAPVRQAPAR
jgi:glycerophosphoryl diester phosphodiesterase